MRNLDCILGLEEEDEYHRCFGEYEDHPCNSSINPFHEYYDEKCVECKRITK